ncbi:hypothetical protein FO519_002334 [Halicephalobus sp. NKZ332]|nr:hypothetical protein FO519_002334 [Halicephalobus sp. NKZ332]
MGAGQSVPAEDKPKVVTIDRSEIPDAYKAVGVSDEVVRRVNQNSISALANDGKIEALSSELAAQRQENNRLKEKMQQLTALQRRHAAGQLSVANAPGAVETLEDVEEKKRVFEETVERVEKQFFNYRRENACGDNEREILDCLSKNNGKILNCKALKAPYDTCIANFRDQNRHQLNPEPSAEFLRIREIIRSSQYFNSDPATACLVIPGIDTLSTERFVDRNDLKLSMEAASRQFSEKPNFLVFNFFGSSLNFGNAIVVSSRHLHSTFRRHFDIAIPAFDVFHNSRENSFKIPNKNFLLPDVLGVVEGSTVIEELMKVIGDDLVISSRIPKQNELNFGELSDSFDFTILSEDLVGFEHLLINTLKIGSVPVIFSDLIVLPFDDVIDWSAFSFTFDSSTLEIGIQKLKSLDPNEIKEMKKMSRNIYDRHFDSIEKIVQKTLQVLELRLTPSKVGPKKEIFENLRSIDEFLIKCNYFIPVVLHRSGIPEGKLQWVLRYFLYAETNASMILIFTEEKIDTLFSDFIIPGKSLPIRIIYVSSVSQYSEFIPNYESQCLLFVIDSAFRSSVLDDQVLENGFSLASDLPHRLTLLSIKQDEDCLSSSCPYFRHVGLRKELIKLEDCVSLSRHQIQGKNTGSKFISWISCSI